MPVLSATGAGVRHRRRWLFRDLDVTVEPGELAAVVGPPGSGRTTVLLALAGRLRLSAGKIEISGTAALGYVPDVTAPEPVFTVAEHVRERLALLGRPVGEVRLHGLDPGLKGWQLSPYQRQVLGVVLAELAAPQVIALDGVEDGLDAAERDALWAVLDGLTERGIAVLITAREVDEARVGTVVHLADPRRPPSPQPPSSPLGGEPVPAEVGAAEPDPVATTEQEQTLDGEAVDVRDGEKS
jgi:ABC-type multidrug transport system ATPase subunit